MEKTYSPALPGKSRTDAPEGPGNDQNCQIDHDNVENDCKGASARGVLVIHNSKFEGNKHSERVIHIGGVIHIVEKREAPVETEAGTKTN